MRSFRLKRFTVKRTQDFSVKTSLKEDFEVVGVVTGPSRASVCRDPVARRRISWEPSPSPGVVGYRIYWAVGKPVDYESEFADVGNVTNLILPTDVPSFPLVVGRMEIGVTTMSESGNESDMQVVSAMFDFKRPDMPLNVRIESI